MLGSNFYPRTLQESATSDENTVVTANNISIHAPYEKVWPQYIEKNDFLLYIGTKILMKNKNIAYLI